MAKTNGHTMRRYEGHKLHLARLAQRKATLLADNGLDLDVAPFWTACPVRGCDCAECAPYEMTREEERYFDYFAELRGWHREEDYYRQLDQEQDEYTARVQAQAHQLVISAWLDGAAL